MRFRDLLGMLLLRYRDISLLLLPIAALSLSLSFKDFLPWYVVALAIVTSLIISESMMRALTDLLLPGNERTWTLWLIEASQSTSEQAKSKLEAISASPESRPFLTRMQHVPTLRTVAAKALKDMK